MRLFRLLRYTLMSAVRSIRVGWKLHVLTAGTIATTFVVAGGGLLLFQNVRAIFLGSRGETEMTVYLHAGKEITGKAEIEAGFCHETFVRRCTYHSASEAKREFVAANPDLASAVSTLAENPFPSSVRIEIDPKFRDTQGLREFSRRIAGLASVERIEEGGEWLVQWVRLLNLVDMLFLAVGVALGIATIFVVSNTIRILVHSKRDEVEVLSLVGASDRIIRAPFLVEGMIQGGIGAAVALLILRLLFERGREFVALRFEGLIPNEIVFLPVRVQIAAVAAGIMLGLVGSSIAVGKFLRS